MAIADRPHLHALSGRLPIIQGGRHIRAHNETPLANVRLSVLRALGLRDRERFAARCRVASARGWNYRAELRGDKIGACRLTSK